MDVLAMGAELLTRTSPFADGLGRFQTFTRRSLSDAVVTMDVYVGYKTGPLALTRESNLAVHKQHLRAGLGFDTSVAPLPLLGQAYSCQRLTLRQIVTATGWNAGRRYDVR